MTKDEDKEIKEMEERKKEREEREEKKKKEEEQKKKEQEEEEKKAKSSVSALAIFIMIFIWVWFITGFIAFLASIICFGFNGSIADKFLGVIIVLIIGPFYWFYFIFNSNYCTRSTPSLQ